MLDIGAWGWEYPAWSGSFYPDDIPTDWRLAYYANEFSVIVAPASHWLDRPEAAQDWLDDITPGFRIWLSSCADLADLNKLEKAFVRVAEFLGDHLQGFILEADSLAEVEAVMAVLPAVLAESGLCVMLTQAAAGTDQLPAKIQDSINGICWPQAGKNASATVGFIEGPITDLRQLRKELENFYAAADGEHHDATLFVTGAPPDLETLRNSRMIGQLLGVD